MLNWLTIIIKVTLLLWGKSCCYFLIRCTFSDVSRWWNVFIESIRNVRNQIKDEKLLEDIKAFIAQEAFHSREHKTLNNHLIHSNYPEVVEIEAKTKARLDKLRQLSAVEQVTATVVMEHYTATLARLLLTDSLIKAKTTQESRNLWEWHALEELEHKSVAFDVLNAIGGNSSKNRKVALARVAKLITPIIFKYWIKILKEKILTSLWNSWRMVFI